MQTHSWDNFRFVLAVFRCETLSAAAQLLNVNETTVSRRLAQTEKTLETQLFSRSSTGYVPTDAGLSLIRRIERAEFEIDAGRVEITGSDRLVSGGVRIAAAPTIINYLLVPYIKELMSEHPNLKIELIASYGTINILRREADIAVRLDRPRDDARVIARKLGSLSYGIYAARHLVEADGAELSDLPWISCDSRVSNLRQVEWMSRNIDNRQHQSARLFVNNTEVLIRCLREGLGKSLVPDVFARQQSGLARLDSVGVPPDDEIWLSYQPELRGIERIRASAQWLEDCLARAGIEKDE